MKGLYASHANRNNDETFIWYTQKSRWGRGPRILLDNSGPWSSASVNASSVIMVFHPAPLRSYLFDFEREDLIEYPFFDTTNSTLEEPGLAVEWISLTTVVTKTSRM